MTHFILIARYPANVSSLWDAHQHPPYVQAKFFYGNEYAYEAPEKKENPGYSIVHCRMVPAAKVTAEHVKYLETQMAYQNGQVGRWFEADESNLSYLSGFLDCLKCPDT